MNQVATDYLLNKYGKKNPPQVKAGDTVRVHQKIKEGDKERVQIFEGLVIATKHGLGLNGSFTVRKIAVGNVGVERTYPVHSPNIIKVERTKNAEVSRAKLYYMRDRKGKAARFRDEVRDLATWSESVELPVSEEVVVAEEVMVQPEGTVEAETVEALETIVENPVMEAMQVDEAVEVEEAVIEAATKQEEVTPEAEEEKK